MNTKRIGRWVIVLFLLAALPGMTTALAQVQEPSARQPLPTVVERGESAVFIPWSNTETEPNENPSQAKSGMRVQGGLIAQGQVDYWVLRGNSGAGALEIDYRDHWPVLIDVETESVGSSADVAICLYSDDGDELACNDNTDTRDSMLYYVLESNQVAGGDWVNRPYYLKVRGVSGSGRYQLLVSYPLLISAAAANLGTGTVDGIPFQAGDILAWSKFPMGLYGQPPIYEKWVMFLDLSDLGVKVNLTNLSSGWRNSDYLLVGFAKNVKLPGINQTVTPWDVVVYNPTTIGPRTEGAFQGWWGGRTQGLTTTAEKIDAIDWPDWNGYTRLYVSTAGKANVYGGPANPLILPDEDVGLWMDGPADEFYPLWTRALDASVSVRPSWAAGDIVAFSYRYYEDDIWDDYRFVNDWVAVVQGTVQCTTDQWDETPFVVTQKDIIELWRTGYLGDDDKLHCNSVWHGPDHQWNYNIDAIDYPLLVYSHPYP